MKFKQFKWWCEERACDGCWGVIEAQMCIEILRELRAYWPWQREKEWQRQYKEWVMEHIVNPINAKIGELPVERVIK